MVEHSEPNYIQEKVCLRDLIVEYSKPVCVQILPEDDLIQQRHTVDVERKISNNSNNLRNELLNLD